MNISKIKIRITSYSCIGLVFVCFGSKDSLADEFFNPALLSNGIAEVADLSRFNKGGNQAPGVYRVDIYLNGTFIVTRDVNFVEAEDSHNSESSSTGLKACLNEKFYDENNVLIKKVETGTETNPDCFDITQEIPMSKVNFDFEKLRVDISIPQAFLRNSIRGYIPPEKWDEGIPSALLNYNFTGSNNKQSNDSHTNNTYFLGLNSGANIGPWRIRNYSTWSYNESHGISESKWSNINTYIERGFNQLKSSLLIGDSNTSSDIFDSHGFRGIQLSSNDNMYPDSMRGFAPTIRGVANSNAKVTIKQNGYVIYESYVPPGAFEINDLFPTSSSGDLDVTVTENNGKINRYTVPYSAVPLLQREGRVKYAVTLGKYRSGNIYQNEPEFGQGSLIYGLGSGATVYGGTQLADNYRSFAIGLGQNLGGWGAISSDITHSFSSLADGKNYNGQSLRFLYAKSLNELGTNFQLLGYRYSTKGFYTLSDVSYKDLQNHNVFRNRKSKFQASVSQQVGYGGSLYLSASRENYWHSSIANELLQFGYNGSWKGMSYGLSYAYNKYGMGSYSSDNKVSFNISVPFSAFFDNPSLRNHSMYSTYAVTHDSSGRVSQLAGVGGTLLEGNNLNYNIQQGYENNNTGSSGIASIYYQGGYANSNLSYSYARDYKQVYYGVSGGIVAHENGVTFSQPLGDTNVLISAQDASNIKVENTTGITTDWHGYAVVPYATAYRMNRISLKTESLDNNVDLDNTVVNVVPTKGALVRANFSTRIGARAMMTLTKRNGRPIPYGAVVTTSDKESSIVGENGIVYISGLKNNGILSVSWGANDDQNCDVQYSLSKDSTNKIINYFNGSCK